MAGGGGRTKNGRIRGTPGPVLAQTLLILHTEQDLSCSVLLQYPRQGIRDAGLLLNKHGIWVIRLVVFGDILKATRFRGIERSSEQTDPG